ncbi:MAG: hypothetical protein WA484_04010 [Solirubrobacteraceae bacterium]
MIERSDIEEVDALPVLTPEPSSRELSPRSLAPTVQAAAVAAGGFVAGAVVVGVLGHRHKRTLAAPARGRGRGKRGAREIVEIVGSRSLLVDVHLLGAPARSR